MLRPGPSHLRQPANPCGRGGPPVPARRHVYAPTRPHPTCHLVLAQVYITSNPSPKGASLSEGGGLAPPYQPLTTDHCDGRRSPDQDRPAPSSRRARDTASDTSPASVRPISLTDPQNLLEWLQEARPGAKNGTFHLPPMCPQEQFQSIRRTCALSALWILAFTRPAG